MSATVQESERLAGEIAVDIFDRYFWSGDRFRYGSAGGVYEMLSLEDANALGFADDDPYLTIMRRVSDGQLFTIEIEIMARAFDPPQPERQEIPGQESLPIGGAS